MSQEFIINIIIIIMFIIIIIQWTLVTTTTFVSEDVAIKLNLLFYRTLHEQIDM